MSAKAADGRRRDRQRERQRETERRAPKTSVFHIELEAGRAHVDDEAAAVAGIELAAQIADMDVDDVGLRQEFVVPDILKQHGAGDDLSGPAHEIFEQLELARQQIDTLAVAARLALDEIEFERPDFEPRGARAFRRGAAAPRRARTSSRSANGLTR